MQRKQLKDTRLALGLTQQQLADRIHLSRTRYVEIENGANISFDQMVSIASELRERINEMTDQYQSDIHVIEEKIDELAEVNRHTYNVKFFERCYDEKE